MVEDMINTVAFIPVRGGSKSIPLKNIKTLNGRPLVFWAIDAAIQCNEIEEVFVSTDSEKIRNVVNNYDRDDFGKLKCINRSPESATDVATTEFALLEFAENTSADTIVLIQATSPLIQESHLKEALEKFNMNNYDSLLSVVKQKRFIWEVGEGDIVNPVNYSPENRPRRQDFDGYLVENGAFYITKRTVLLTSRVRISGRIGYYEMPEKTYIEIDEPQDWVIMEQLMNKGRTKPSIAEKISSIKLLATDCDGVLTDAGMYYSRDGDVLKKFNTKDGMGLSLLKKSGIILAIITGENSEIVSKRAEKLGIENVYLGCKNKVAAMEELLKKYDLEYKEVGYIGDDINDLDLLSKVGVSFTVQNAISDVKDCVNYITHKNGGEGAVREVTDLILKYKA